MLIISRNLAVISEKEIKIKTSPEERAKTLILNNDLVTRLFRLYILNNSIIMNYLYPR